MCRKFPICFSNSGHLKDWRFAFFFRRRKRQSIWLGKLIMKMQTFVTTNLRETVFTIQGNGLKGTGPLLWSHLREGSHTITISNVIIFGYRLVEPQCSTFLLSHLICGQWWFASFSTTRRYASNFISLL